MAGVRARAVAIPVWAWLTAIVGCSAVVHVLLGRQIVAPWIMVDELVYSELAKSFAAHGQFLIRGVPTSGYGFVYPVLIAPAWRLFTSVPHAYAVAKDINAVVISLTAIPVYFLARRLVGPPLSLVAAALSVLVPSMLYSGTLMTENAFYPLFAVLVLVLVLALERPTLRLQVLLLVLLALAYLTRAQAVALVPAVLVAPVLLGLFERRVRAHLRAWAPTYAIVGAAALVVLAASAVRGRSPLSLLGAYRAATSSSYSVSESARYGLWHVAELDLYLGVIPFAALLVLWLSPRALPRAGQAFVAASLPVTVLLVAEVAAFASRQSQRIEERNMFYVAPFALIALVAVGTIGTRRRRWYLIAGAAAAILPAFIPYDRFITTSAVSDTFALLPWWWVNNHYLSLGQIKWGALGAGIAAGVVFLAVPRRYLALVAVLVAAYFVITTASVQRGRHGIRITAVGSLWAGIHNGERNWVDRKVGHDADVSMIWNGRVSAYAVWENEFFNRSIRTVYDLGGAVPGGLPETPVRPLASGRLVDDAGRAVTARYALTSDGADLVGKVIARDSGIGLYLVRVDGPLIVIKTAVHGLYTDPGDTWSKKVVTYSRSSCAGGKLSVQLQSDANLYRSEQVVTAIVRGKVAGVARIPPTKIVRLVVPLRPDARNVCHVRFDVAKTLVPAQVIKGSTDERPLGAHFLRFDVIQ
ncbi:MAG TPA: glycosyltransferase family 39 protein [Gaiellaceae bacterium]|nr:glycosyltransferase family 39 protein [Gaiellaceae bacterium]